MTLLLADHEPNYVYIMPSKSLAALRLVGMTNADLGF